jgi:hypothetical protein
VAEGAMESCSLNGAVIQPEGGAIIQYGAIKGPPFASR